MTNGASRILKYPIGFDPVEVPCNAFSVVHAGHDPGGQLCVWAIVKHRASDRAVVQVLGTGARLPAGWVYVAAVRDGQFMWHVVARDEVTVP